MRSGPVKRIAVYAGPTGGHLFPAQSFAEAIRRELPSVRLELVTCRRGEKLVGGMPSRIFDQVLYLPDFGLPHRIWSFKSLKPLLLAPYLFAQAIFYLLSFKPDLCVGFGSFVSYPGVMAARWFGIPALVHEQNRIPGKATCWLAPHVNAVAVSFDATKLPSKTKNVRTIGLPLRAFITDRPRSERKQNGRLQILVIGGSQGAQGLNRIVTAALGCLSREEREKIAVTHITGDKELEGVSQHYRSLGVACETYPFYRNMFELFQKTDLAITRAGANTLFELAFYGIPAFVIPFPYAGGHQKYNAEAFAGKGGLEYHDESPGASDWLVNNLRSVLTGKKDLERMAASMTGLAKPRAAEDLARMAGQLIKDT